MKTSFVAAAFLIGAAQAGAQDAASLLEQKCVRCHAGEKKKAGLDLSTREGLLNGGDGGPAAVPGDAKRSFLYRVVTHQEEPFMPHKGEKLPPEAIARLAAWIDAGASYERTLVAKGNVEVHWAFRPLRRPEAAFSIDGHLRSALAARGLAMNGPADRRTLIRRVTFDLIGLPPTAEETEAFVSDPAPDAYEKLVGRLLASPHHGERWARHWLDLARYADSDGYRFDYDRKNAWPYRDFVIRALNDDLPYDTFVKWQLAGDELAPGNPLAASATGFCTAGPIVEKQPGDAPKNQERYRYDELDDIVSTAGSALLGLTLGCARCHDHKYDPIPTRDYYRLVAAFTTSKRTDAILADADAVAGYRRRDAEFQKRAGPLQAKLKEFLDRAKAPLALKKINALKIREDDKEILRLPPDKSNQRQQELLTIHQKQIAVSDAELRKALKPEEIAEWTALAARVSEFEKERPPAPPQALVLTDAKASPQKSWLLDRGEVEKKKEAVTLGFLSALGNPEPSVRRPEGAKTTFQRAALAEWITDVDRGAGRLLARVIVNRLWQHHFGEGLVRTPNDFGAQGEPPSHPDLLDALACELIARGWRLKEMHRLIVTSEAYRQAGTHDPAKAKVDPENRLLWRKSPRRIEAEILRDALLAVSGRLNPEMYGPGAKLPVPAEAIITRTEGEHHYPRDVKDGPPVWRRSVYTFIKRSVMVPMLEAFDVPSPSGSCGRRVPTTVSPQALVLLHEPFVRARAHDFADRVRAEGGGVDRAYLVALGRRPDDVERAASREFLERQAARRGGDDRLALADFCHVLFTLNEFLYVD